MKRRHFIQSAALASAVPLNFTQMKADETRQIYEWRTYDISFGGNLSLLLSYLRDVYGPALQRHGADRLMLFRDYGLSNPVKLHALIVYPDASAYIRSQDLSGDADFMMKAKEYDQLGPEKPIFTRFSSSLLLAFTGLPVMNDPVEGASLFELRTYEGYSEDATRRKIRMFNVEEIDLFYRTGLHPVFFGDMIAGPYRPSLVYMLGFKDMAERDANWQTFIDHPEWKEMSSKSEYANSVSNIRRSFLIPA